MKDLYRCLCRSELSFIFFSHGAILNLLTRTGLFFIFIAPFSRSFDSLGECLIYAYTKVFYCLRIYGFKSNQKDNEYLQHQRSIAPMFKNEIAIKLYLWLLVKANLFLVHNLPASGDHRIKRNKHQHQYKIVNSIIFTVLNTL